MKVKSMISVTRALITASVIGLCVFFAIGASSAWAIPGTLAAVVVAYYVVKTA